jgi:hypothetical protein
MHGGKVPSPIATVRRNRRRLPSRLPSRVRVRVWACAFPVKGRRIYVSGRWRGRLPRPCPLWLLGTRASRLRTKWTRQRWCPTPWNTLSAPTTGVLVGDHQPNLIMATLLQGAKKPTPEHLVLRIADVEAENFPAAGRGHPGGDHSHRGDLPGPADVEIGRVDEHVGNPVWCSGRDRNASTCSSSPVQILLTSDFEMPDSTPSAATRSSTARVDTPLT